MPIDNNATGLQLYPFEPHGPRAQWMPSAIKAPAPIERPADMPIHQSLKNGILYRFFNAEGALLYIGVTNWSRKPQRWVDHQRSSAWWGLVAFVAIECIPYSGGGNSPIEREAIRRERPLYNVIHNRRPASIELRLDEGPQRAVEALRYRMFPEDFAALVRAFKAEPEVPQPSVALPSNITTR